MSALRERTLALPADEYAVARSMADFVAANGDLDFSEILFAIDQRWPSARFKTVFYALALAVHEGHIANPADAAMTPIRPARN